MFGGVNLKVSIRVQTAAAQQFQRQLLPLVSALLVPSALMAAALGVWRVGSDMEWMGDFPIEDGFFSHWQVWMSLGVLMQIAAYHLSRLRRQ